MSYDSLTYVWALFTGVPVAILVLFMMFRLIKRILQ